MIRGWEGLREVPLSIYIIIITIIIRVPEFYSLNKGLIIIIIVKKSHFSILT